MRILCVSGGIGSGKSTVSRILGSMGALIIDADQVSREITLKGSKALNELVEQFGDEILNSDGELNRKKLGKIVFENAEKLKILDSITTNKYIKESLKEKVEKARAEIPDGILVIEAIVPFEKWFRELVDEIWVVISDIEVRLQRIAERNDLSKEEALLRIRSQKSDDEYIRIAGRIIYNNSGYEELRYQVLQFIKGDEFEKVR